MFVLLNSPLFKRQRHKCRQTGFHDVQERRREEPQEKETADHGEKYDPGAAVTLGTACMHTRTRTRGCASLLEVLFVTMLLRIVPRV